MRNRLIHGSWLCAFLLALPAAVPYSAGAAPVTHPLLCSGGELAPAKTAAGARAFIVYTGRTTAANATAAVCGWRTGPWPANQPKLLCLTPAALDELKTRGLGTVSTQGPPIDTLGALNLEGLTEFSTLGYAGGCLNVTSAAPYAAEGPPTTLVCHDAIVANMHAEPINLGNQRAFPIQPGKPPASALAAGSCFAVGAYPSDVPPSRLLCIDKTFLAEHANHFENAYPGTYAIHVSPWWPCGIASRVKTP